MYCLIVSSFSFSLSDTIYLIFFSNYYTISPLSDVSILILSSNSLIIFSYLSFYCFALSISSSFSFFIFNISFSNSVIFFDNLFISSSLWTSSLYKFPLVLFIYSLRRSISFCILCFSSSNSFSFSFNFYSNFLILSKPS